MLNKRQFITTGLAAAFLAGCDQRMTKEEYEALYFGEQEPVPLPKIQNINFQADIERASYDAPVFVTLSADWCPPCKVMDEVMPEVFEPYTKKGWSYIKIDIEDPSNELIVQGLKQGNAVPDNILVYKGQIIRRLPGYSQDFEQAMFKAGQRAAEKLDRDLLNAPSREQ